MVQLLLNGLIHAKKRNFLNVRVDLKKECGVILFKDRKRIISGLTCTQQQRRGQAGAVRFCQTSITGDLKPMYK